MDHRNERQANATLHAAADSAAAARLAALRRTGQAAMHTHTKAPRPRPLLKAVFVLAVLLSTLALTGCGGGDPEPDQPTPDVNCALQPVVCK